MGIPGSLLAFGNLPLVTTYGFGSFRPSNWDLSSSVPKHDRNLVFRPLNNLQWTKNSEIYLTDDQDFGKVVSPDRVNELIDTVKELKVESDEANTRAMMAEEQIKDIQRQIEAAEEKLEGKDNFFAAAEMAWFDEKNGLMDRLANLGELIKSKDDDSRLLTDSLNAAANRRENSLRTEISYLTESLENAQRVLEDEKEKVEELKARLFKTEDSLEFEQMRYANEKKELDKRIIEEKSKYILLEKKKKMLEEKVLGDTAALAEIQGKLEEEKQKFSKEKKVLENELESSNRVRQLKARQMGERYNQIRQEMTSLWMTAKSDARKQERKLKKMISQQTDDMTKLEQELSQAQLMVEELKEAKDDLEKQKEVAAKAIQEMKDNFSSTLSDRDVVILGLEENISSYKDQEIGFRTDIDNLKSNLSDEKAKRIQVEDDYSSQQMSFELEKKKIQDQIDEKDRISKLKIKQMWERFNEKRSEMTSMLVQARTDARKDEKKMKDSYEKRLSEQDVVLSKVKDELRSADMNLAQEKDNVISLSAEVSALTQNVTDLCCNISQRDEQIVQYESSYRQLLKLSVRLTGKRIRKSTSRIGSFISKRKKKKQ